jgi:hypothetical protein
LGRILDDRRLGDDLGLDLGGHLGLGLHGWGPSRRHERLRPRNRHDGGLKWDCIKKFGLHLPIDVKATSQTCNAVLDVALLLLQQLHAV